MSNTININPESVHINYHIKTIAEMDALIDRLSAIRTLLPKYEGNVMGAVGGGGYGYSTDAVGKMATSGDPAKTYVVEYNKYGDDSEWEVYSTYNNRELAELAMNELHYKSMRIIEQE